VRFAAETAREVENKYVAAGLVKIVFLDFVIRGEPSVMAAEAAHCAQDQEQFLAYHDLLFKSFSGQPFTRQQLDSIARKLKLDMADFRQCLDSHKYQAFVIASTQDARRNGITGAPTILVNQQSILGFVPFEELQPIIEEELSKVP
jgi:protein-disulfide isomerase